MRRFLIEEPDAQNLQYYNYRIDYKKAIDELLDLKYINYELHQVLLSYLVHPEGMFIGPTPSFQYAHLLSDFAVDIIEMIAKDYGHELSRKKKSL